MNTEMIKKAVNVSLTLMELGGVAALTGIALKRNKDCYVAQCEKHEAEVKLIVEEAKHELSNMKVKKLQEELEELKSKSKFKFMKKES